MIGGGYVIHCSCCKKCIEKQKQHTELSLSLHVPSNLLYNLQGSRKRYITNHVAIAILDINFSIEVKRAGRRTFVHGDLMMRGNGYTKEDKRIHSAGLKQLLKISSKSFLTFTSNDRDFPLAKVRSVQ